MKMLNCDFGELKEPSMDNETQIETQSLTADEVIKMCRTALRNAGGAYNTLRIIGADKHLPGLFVCETNMNEALKAIESYLNNKKD